MTCPVLVVNVAPHCHVIDRLAAALSRRTGAGEEELAINQAQSRAAEK